MTCPYLVPAPTSAHVNIVVAKNTTFSDAFQFDEDTVTDWDFNSKSFLMDIKGNFEQAAALISLASADGEIVVDDPVLRILHFNVTDTALQAVLVPGVYLYDLIMVDQFDVRTQLMHGQFIFGEGVTGG